MIPEQRHLMGVFLDFENLALGFRDQSARFDVQRVMARLVEKGNIVVKVAYADWKRFQSYAGALTELAFELYQIPARHLSGKNSADMKICVDIMDLCWSKSHIDTFVIVSGDSDFSPLVSKLKENGKTVIGLGMKDSTSALLRDNCDEFIYYEDLEKEVEDEGIELEDADEKDREVFGLLLDSLKALERENRDVYWASLIKETMKRKKPSFNETYYGFKSFSELLEEAEDRKLVTLASSENNRSLSVRDFGSALGGGKRRSKRKSRSSRGGTGSGKKKVSTRNPRP